MIKIFNINDMSKEDYSYYYSLMSEKKKNRVDAFRFEDDKKRTVCAEMTIRKMIAESQGIPVQDIVIATDKNGKPYAENIDLSFSLSHSNDYVLAVLNNRAVGADIEKMRKVEDRLIKYVCTDKELIFVLKDPEQKYVRFFIIWTAKEAYFKCKGTGIKNLKDVCTLDEDFQKHLQTFFEDDYVISIYSD